MAQPSVTSRDSFALRMQRSEQWRAAFIAAAFGISLVIVLVRRLMSAVVMSVDVVFYPTLAVLTAGIALNLGLWRWARARTAAGALINPHWWTLSAAADLAVPLACLAVLVAQSPRGPVAALSAPVLLLAPIVIMLSALRLQPRLSLASGAVAGLFHLGLVIHSLATAEVEISLYPVLKSYGVYLLLTGVGAAGVAWRIKRYVVETLEEGLASERAKQALANVERDLSVARDIQRGLLPAAAPPLAGFDIAGMNRPADQTGGDYYDWQPLPDGRLAVVLADVTGHGIGPALVMAVCRAYSRASAPGTPSPGALLERLNGLIHEDLQGARFITMALALVGPEGTVQLASAGHGPTMLYTARTDAVQWFGGDGLPLGVMPDERYTEQRTFTLSKGDVLVLQTDGFVEWARASDDEQFGLERMMEAVRAAAKLPAQAMIESIDGAVRAFAEGSPQGDDMTAVIIKRL